MASAVIDIVKLYVSPTMQTFPRDKLQSLMTYLQDSEKSTSIVDISSPSDLQFNKTGRTKSGGLRMTYLMFQQCAQKLGPGTGRFISSMVGPTQPADAAQMTDTEFAIAVWNKTVSLRLAPLQKYRMIKNQQTRQLEGLVGNRQHYLNNYEILERAITACSDAHGDACSFYGAKLVGRSMTLWFRHNTPMLTLTVDGITSAFYGGYYFTVQEASGTAMRGTMAVFCPQGVCLAPYKQFGGRAARNQNGEKFDDRLSRLFSKVFDGRFERDVLLAGVQALPDTSLGFTADMLKDKRERHAEYVLKMLRSFGVQKDLAVVILSDTLHMGHDIPEAPSSQQLSLLFSRRSMLDLFVHLLRKAKVSRPGVREKLELLAYRVIAKRLNF